MKSASNQIQQILNSPLRFHELSTIELDPTTGAVKLTLNNQFVQCPICAASFANGQGEASHHEWKHLKCAAHNYCMSREEAVEHVKSPGHSRCLVRDCKFNGAGLQLSDHINREH
jgi:hypothetical protein